MRLRKSVPSWLLLSDTQRWANNIRDKNNANHPFILLSDMPTTSRTVAFTPHQPTFLDPNVRFVRSNHRRNPRYLDFLGYAITDIHEHPDSIARAMQWAAWRGQRYRRCHTNRERSSLEVGFHLLVLSNQGFFHRPRKLSRFAKIMIATTCAFALTLVVAVSLGFLLSGTRTTVTTVLTTTEATSVTASNSIINSTSSGTTNTSLITTTAVTATTVGTRYNGSQAGMRYLLVFKFHLVNRIHFGLLLFFSSSSLKRRPLVIRQQCSGLVQQFQCEHLR